MNKKVIIYFSLFIVLLFIFSVSIVLFFKSNSKKTVVKKDDIYIEATTLKVTMKDLISVSDEFGKSITNDNGGSFGYIDIDLVNDVDEQRKFELYITQINESDKAISPSFIKVYLTDSNDNPIGNFDSGAVPSFVNLNYLKKKATSKLLLTGSLEANEEANLRLRTWISDSFVVSDGEYSYSYEIGVHAVE